MYGENRTSIQCTTPSLAKLALQPPVVTKVAFVLDGYSTDQLDLIYVEDPLFQDPKLTSKDNKSILELKVRERRRGDVGSVLGGVATGRRRRRRSHSAERSTSRVSAAKCQSSAVWVWQRSCAL